MLSRPPIRPRDQRALAVVILVAWIVLAVVAFPGWRSGRSEAELDPTADRPATALAAFSLDINSATWPELALLPGIGEKLAKRVVTTRKTTGPFSSHDALLAVSGIGPKKLADIRPFLLPLGSASGTPRPTEPPPQTIRDLRH